MLKILYNFLTLMLFQICMTFFENTCLYTHFCNTYYVPSCMFRGSFKVKCPESGAKTHVQYFYYVGTGTNCSVFITLPTYCSCSEFKYSVNVNKFECSNVLEIYSIPNPTLPDSVKKYRELKNWCIWSCICHNNLQKYQDVKIVLKS